MDEVPVPSHQNNSDEADFAPLDLDAFQVISDWYHYAILELASTKDCKASPSYISDRLGIPSDQASHANNLLTSGY